MTIYMIFLYFVVLRPNGVERKLNCSQSNNNIYLPFVLVRLWNCINLKSNFTCIPLFALSSEISKTKSALYTILQCFSDYKWNGSINAIEYQKHIKPFQIPPQM